ncbi:MAG: diguanylate cyclase domain-containing protein [Syntrophales bacterium]
MKKKLSNDELMLRLKELEKMTSDQRRLEEVYRSVVESTSDSIYMVDRECRYLFMNNQHLTRLGLPAEQIIGKRYSEFHSPEQHKVFAEEVNKVFLTGESVQHEHKSQRDKRYFLRTFSPVRDSGPNGVITCVVIISTDITDHRRAEEAIRESEQKYRTIIENIEDGYHELDFSGNIVFFNDALLKMLGYSRDEFARMNYRKLTDEETARQMSQVCDEVYKTGKPSRGIEIEVMRKDGTTRVVEISVSLILDAKGQEVGFRNLIRDVTERKKTEETIRRLAYHDPLTGLPNRLLFTDRLNMAITRAKRNRQYLAVMMLDLDYFKDINDTLGHHMGDRLLQAVGSRLTELLRKGDTIARMGGDEFLILLPEINNVGVTTTIAQKIVESFQSPFIIDDRKLQITTSIGIAIYPDVSDDVETLIKNADIAMYRAKGSGRNNYQLFIPEMIVKASS